MRRLRSDHSNEPDQHGSSSGSRIPRFGNRFSLLTNKARERFAGFQRGFEDLERHEADLVRRLDIKDHAFAVVTLVPDVSGDFALDTKAMRQFQQQTSGKDPWLIPRGTCFERATVGSRV